MLDGPITTAPEVYIIIDQEITPVLENVSDPEVGDIGLPATEPASKVNVFIVLAL